MVAAAARRARGGGRGKGAGAGYAERDRAGTCGRGHARAVRRAPGAARAAMRRGAAQRQGGSASVAGILIIASPCKRPPLAGAMRRKRQAEQEAHPWGQHPGDRPPGRQATRNPLAGPCALPSNQGRTSP